MCAPLNSDPTVFTPSDMEPDITKLDFFDFDYRFIKDGTSEIIFPSVPPNITGWNATRQYPNVWEPADSLAKTLYSTILADLGRHDSTIITDTSALQHYTADFEAILALPNMNARPGPAQKSYEDLKGSTGNIDITPAVISIEYLCQVPQRKPLGSLIISILVADLVFLQSLWKILTLCTSAYVQRQKPRGKAIALIKMRRS